MHKKDIPIKSCQVHQCKLIENGDFLRSEVEMGAGGDLMFLPPLYMFVRACVHAYVCVVYSVCMHEEASIGCKVPCCHSPHNSLETRSLSEPGIRLVAGWPQQFSCLCQPNLWSCRCMQGHEKLFTWVLEI